MVRLFEGLECEAEDFFEGAIWYSEVLQTELDEFNFSNSSTDLRHVMCTI